MGDRSVFYKTIGVNTEDEEDKNDGKRGDRSVFYSTVQEDKKQTPEPASASDYDSLILPTPQQWAERTPAAKPAATAPSYTPLIMRMADKAEEARKMEEIGQKAPGVGKATPGAAGGGGRGKTTAEDVARMEAEKKAAERYAAAMQPTSDMYLNKTTAELADYQQKEANRARAKAEELSEKIEKSPIEQQREKTEQARRELRALAYSNNTPEGLKKYEDKLEEFNEENEKLHEMGGRFGLKEDAQTAAENLGAGVLGSIKGIINAAGYAGQEMTRGQLMEQQSVMSGLPGQQEIADRSAKTLQEVKDRGLQSWADPTLNGIGKVGKFLVERPAQAEAEQTAEMWRRAGREDRAKEMDETAKALKSADGKPLADTVNQFMQTAAQHAQASGKVASALAQTANGVGGMVPSILSNVAAPGSGLWVMAAQAAGNATEEALAAGAQDEKAVLYGGAVAAVEVLTEKMFGGIPGLNVGSLDDAVENLIKKNIGSEAAQRAVLFLVDALGEGAEEFISEFADWGLNKWLVGSDKRSFDEVRKDAWYSAFIGALTSVAMSGPVELFKSMSPRQVAQKVAQEMDARLETERKAEALKLPEVQQATENAAQGRTAEELALPAVPARVENPGLVRDAELRRAGLTSREQRTLDALGKVIGVEIRFTDTLGGNLRNGKYENGVITLARDAVDPVMSTVVHETIHHIRDAAPKAYGTLQNFVRENMSDRMYGLNTAVREELYGQNTDISEEVVADAFGRIMADADLAQRFVTENRTAAQKIADALHDLLVKVQRYITGNTAKTLTDDQRAAFVELQEHLGTMLNQYEAAARAAGESETRADRGARWSYGDVNTENTDASELNQGNAYSYDALIKKDPVRVVPIQSREIPTREKRINANALTAEARAKAPLIVYQAEDGATSEQRYVYVPDLGANVLFSTKGVLHGAVGNIANTSTRTTAEITPDLAEILQNSIKVNERGPRENPKRGDGEYSHILIGAAQNEKGDVYIIRSQINHFADNKSVLESMEIYDVLKGAKAKKMESEVMRTVGIEMPKPNANTTDSYYSVADLLSLVKENYPEILPDSVLDHFGLDKSIKDKSYRYSISDRGVLARIADQYGPISPDNANLDALRLPTAEEWRDRDATATQPEETQTGPGQLPTAEEWKNRGTEPQPVEMETEEPAATPGEPAAPEGPVTPEEMSDGGRSVNGYAASPGLRKLGVKIAEPITDTIGADVLVSQAQKAKAAERALNKAIKKLAPTKAEKALAQGLADGTYTEGNGILYGKDGAPIRDVNMNKVRELAEYYRQKNQYKRDRIAEQRRTNRDRETAIDEDLLKYADNFKKMSALRLNLNTMKRNMLAWAGQTLGAKINQHLFDPVTQNSAERIRFVNRMLDRVREFHLTKAESEMVQRVIEGTAVQDQVSKLTEDARRRVNAAAESNDLNLTAAEYNLPAEEKKLAQRYHDWLQTQAQLKNMDADKINAAAKAYSDAYSDFYTAINEFLVMHGYEPIGFIQGYAPHLQPDNVQSTLGKVMSIFGLDAEVSALPTDIAGQTENYKPGKQWNPYFQHRAGADSMIDAVAGYESYVNYLSNVLYHTDDIQKLRTFIRTLRGMYASEEIREKLDQAKWIKGQGAEEKADFLRINKMIDEGTQLTPEMANDLIDKYVDGLYDSIENKTKHGDVASVLEDYTNKLAGKQTKLDRAVESFFGRRNINFGNALSRIFGESAVVGNLSSALNQLSQLPAVQAEVGNKYVLQAIGDIIRGNAANMDQESDFLTGKLGTDSLLAERSWKDSDSKQRHAKVTNAMSIPFEAVDTLASRLYVRAKYLQEIENGATHEAAMKAADNFAERVVGNRIQGSRPMVFESKNAFVKLFSTFQLEVANAWAHISQDLPAEIKAVEKSQGKAAAVQRTAAILMRYGISAFLLNRLTDAIYGGTPAPFDLIGYVLGGIAEGKGESVNEYLIQLVSDLFGLGGDDDDDEDKEFDVGAALKETGSLLVGDMPYVRNAASMLGYGDTTLPLPSVGKTAKSLSDLISGKGSWGDVGESALRDAATWLPGGNQAKKTAQGIETIAKQGRYNRSGNLMYPVDMSGAEGLAKAMKAGLFGPSSLGATDSYYASGDKALSEKQTAAYEELVKIGEDRDAVYDTIMRFRKVEDVKDSDEDGKKKRDVLRNAEMSDYSKARLYETLFSSEGSYEKLAGLMDTGITFDDCMDILDKYNEQKYTGEKPGIQASRFAQWVDQTYEPEVAEKIKEQYSYWTNVRAEPSAYEKAQAAGVDIDTAAAAMEIKNAAKGKKDENGETIDDTKKAEVIRGVDALDCSEEDKIKLLEKSGYKMDGYNRVSFFMSLSDYADAVELQAMATGKKDDQGRTISGSKELEVMKGVNFLNKDLTPREKTRVMQALGYDTDDADKAPMIWDTDYTGKDYEAYYYLTGSQRQGFEKYCDWMPVQDYAKYADSIGEFQTIKDKNGKTTVSRQDQVIEYINALNLTPDQKTALYVASGYNPNLTDNAFKVCPWWNRLALRSEYYPTK